MQTYELLILLTTIFMVVECIITTLIPMYWKGLKSDSPYISFAGSFSGGVVLTVGVLHILADADKQMHRRSSSQYPWAYVIALITFCCVLCIEKLFAEHHSHGNQSNHVDIMSPATPSKKQRRVTFGAIILTLALCLHSILEGTALGFEQTTAGATRINLNKSGATKKEQWILQLPVIASCPIGVGIAYALTGVDPIIQAIGLSMSAGTFLYVGAAEIISEEFASHKKKKIKTKVFCLIIGVILICFVMAFDKPAPIISEDDDEPFNEFQNNETEHDSWISDKNNQ